MRKVIGLVAVLMAGSVAVGGGDDPAPGRGTRERIRDRFGTLVERSRVAPRPARYGLNPRPSYRPNDPGRPTVVVVHGINSTSDSFVHLAAALEADGFGVVAYDYPFDRDLDRTVGDFARDWAEFRKQHEDARPWSVVTHSMGALLVRAYVEGDDYAGDVDHLFLIGPTNGGAAIARAQPILQLTRGLRAGGDRRAGALSGLQEGLGAAAEDLAPGSEFLRRLNARPRRVGVRYHILAGSSGFLSAEDRARVETRLAVVSRSGGVLGGLTKLAAGGAAAALDEMTEGTGDGCVAIASTRLEGVEDHAVIAANHVELIRGPLLYPDPGPIACMPFLRERMPGPKAAK